MLGFKNYSINYGKIIFLLNKSVYSQLNFDRNIVFLYVLGIKDNLLRIENNLLGINDNHLSYSFINQQLML
jgi:hypothetical protein